MIEQAVVEIIKDKKRLKELNINDRDILILELRCGLIDGKEYTYDQIGKMVWSTHACFKYSIHSPHISNISRERVRQVVHKCIRKIRSLSKC